MSKEERKVPELRFKGFHDDWEQRKLGEVFKQTSKFVNPEKENLELWSLTVENGLTPKTARYNRSFLVKKNDKFKTVNNNEFIYNPMNMTLGAVDLNSTGKTVAVSGYYITMITKPNFDSKYFNFWLKSAIAIKNYKIYATGSLIERQRIQFPTLSQIKTKVPSISEQQRIGNILMKLDRIITLHQESITKIDKVLQIFQTKMFANLQEDTPKIRNVNYSDHWNQLRLGDIGNTFTSLSGKTKDDFGHGDAEYVPYLNVFSNPIADTSLTDKIMKDSKQNNLKYGDILFTISSETPNEVGMSSVWLDNRPDVYLNSFCFGFRPVVTYNHLFLASLLRSDIIRKQMYILAQGVSRYNISKVKAMDIKLKAPGYDEQVDIGRFLKLLNSRLMLQKQKIKVLQELKKVYLRKMFL